MGIQYLFYIFNSIFKYWNDIFRNNKKEIKNDNNNILLFISFGLYGIPSKMFSEYGGMCVSLLFLLLSIIIKIYKKIKINFWYFFGIKCFEIGYYFLIFSSGLKNRKKVMKSIKDYITITEFLNYS